jgi:DNA replication protein
MTNGKLIQEALNDLAARREFAENDADRKRAEALSVPEIAALTRDLSTLSFELAENPERETEIKNKLEELEKKRVVALKNAGFNSYDFKPKYRCDKCRDTGFVNGKFCSCVKSAYYEKLNFLLGIAPAPDYTFEKSDLSVVKNTEQRALLKALYAAFTKYVKKFPDVNTKNALLMGGTGVGKTYLVASVLNGVKARGFSAMFLTAIELNHLMLNYHTSPVAERDIFLQDVLDCDFLVIDDLGTEQKLKNVTEEYLLLILSTREAKQKPVFLSTNLRYNDLKSNYNERLLSRMANRNTTIVKEILGDDIRLE